MKTLVDYIKEAKEKECEKCASKSFTFNFNGIENTEDFLKSLEGNECVTLDDNKVTVNVEKDCENCDKLYELFKDFIQLAGKSQKRASDEQYAQKLQSLEKKLGDWSDFNEEEPEEEGKEGEDKKDKEGKEEE